MRTFLLVTCVAKAPFFFFFFFLGDYACAIILTASYNSTSVPARPVIPCQSHETIGMPAAPTAGSARNRLWHQPTSKLDMATRLLPAFGSCLKGRYVWYAYALSFGLPDGTLLRSSMDDALICACSLLVSRSPLTSRGAGS